MVLVENKVNDRRDRQIQEAIDVRNWRQALSLCEKRLKKGEKSDHLSVLKARVLLSFPDSPRQRQGRDDINALLQRDPPITDVQAIVILEECLRQIEATDAEIGVIWERAVRLRPQDEELQTLWFKNNFEQRRWKGAQKASMSLQKNFPKARQYFFWAIVANYMAANIPTASDMDRRLFGGLAYKLVSKAASDVPADIDLKNTGRTLRSAEDVMLLLEVCKSQGKYQEALAVLDDPRTGIGSKVAGNHWDLVRGKLDILEASELWQEEWNYCLGLLQDARPDNLQNTDRLPSSIFGAIGDDWRIWTGLLMAAGKLRTQENNTATEDIVRSYSSQAKVSRNAHLAMLRFYSQECATDSEKQERLFESCENHFRDYSAKYICFRDLAPYVGHLDSSRKARLLITTNACAKSVSPKGDASEGAQVSWITSEINALRMDYYLVISHDNNAYSRQLIDAFITSCLRLYKLSSPLGAKLPASERQPGDDACILAVMALIRLFKSGENTALLRGALLLELLLSRSKHNYDALLMLVRIYIHMGAGSLAMKHYAQLKIKNSQNATISWILFTRLSTIHPFPVDPHISSGQDKALCDPAYVLKVALEWQKGSEVQTSRGINQILHNGHYKTLVEALSFLERSQQGLQKFINIIESRRIGRFTGSTSKEDYQDLLDSISPSVVDNRDEEVFPNCEAHDQLRFEELLRCGPKPSRCWLRYQLQICRFLALVNKGPPLKDDLLADELGMDCDTTFNGCTVEENMLSILVERLQQGVFIIQVRETRGALAEQLLDYFRTVMNEVDRWVSYMLERAETSLQDTTKLAFALTARLETPGWHYLHSMFVNLESLQMIHFFLEDSVTRIRDSNMTDLKPYVKDAAPLKTKVLEAAASIRLEVMKLQKQLRGGGVVSELVEASIGHPENKEDSVALELRDLLGESWVEIKGADLLASWEDALDGVLRVKMT